MMDFISLNILLFIFLLSTYLEVLTLSTQHKKNNDNNTSVTILFSLSFCIGLILSFPLLRSSSTFFSKYLLITFILLNSGHMLCLSINQKLNTQLFLFFLTIGIIACRFVLPSELSQNLFIIYGVLWIGPMLSEKKILTHKKLFFICVAWIVYNLIFYFTRSSSIPIFNKTEEMRLPFSLTVGNTYFGIIDLLVPNMIISVLRKHRMKIVAILLIVSSNLLAGILVYRFHLFTVFPIALVWTILAIPLIIIDKKPNPK